MKDSKDINTAWMRIESKVDTLLNMFTAVTEAQTILSQNQEVILSKLNKISTTLDKFLKQTPPKYYNNDTQLEKLTPKVIDSEESINKFEQSLKDHKFEQEMTKTFSIVCGKGKGRAINNAYVLIDSLFDRNFLTQCSWAGGSRTDETKLCFKSYKRIINFFFKMIHQSDQEFTMIECESFLKNILRNSKKRCEAKYLKASSRKRRMSRKEYEKRLVENKIGEALMLVSGDGTENQDTDEGSNEEQDWGTSEEYGTADQE